MKSSAVFYVKDPLVRFMERELHYLFTESQQSFRKGRNTTGAIHNLMEQLYKNFNFSAITQGIFLDFSKAFDTIDHQILIDKLTFYFTLLFVPLGF